MSTPTTFLTRLHRPLAGLTVALGVLAVISVVGWIVDDRVINGAAIWAKPFKFAVSFGLYAFTLAWLVSLLPTGRLARLASRWSTALTAALALEIGAIVLQVVRGRASHFNRATPFDTAVYGAMGAFAVVIFLTTIVVGVLVLRGADLRERALTWSLRLGLGISLAGMSIGFLMARPTTQQLADPESPTLGAHGVGAPDGGPALPLLGWSTTVGDLRVSHFIGLHALQALPLLALALATPVLARRIDPASRTRLALVAATSYGAFFALTLWQALRGQAVTSPDPWTWTAVAVVLLATLGGVTVSLRPSSTVPDANEPPTEDGRRLEPQEV